MAKLRRAEKIFGETNKAPAFTRALPEAWEWAKVQLLTLQGNVCHILWPKASPAQNMVQGKMADDNKTPDDNWKSIGELAKRLAERKNG